MLILSVCLLAGETDAQVELENSATLSSAVSTYTTSFTIGNGHSRMLVVGVAMLPDETSKFVTSMSFEGQSLTFVNGVTNPDLEVRTEIWYLLDPPTGAGNLTTNFNTTTDHVTGMLSFAQVNQLTPITANNTFSTDGGAPSLTIASESRGLVFDVVSRDETGNFTPGANQTELWDISPSVGFLTAGSIEDGAASITMSWTSNDNGEQSSQTAIAIKPRPDTGEICGNGIDDNADGQIDEVTPAAVGDNLLLWLKADTEFSASLWKDQSTMGNHATVFGNPTQVSNSLNGHTGLNFDGNDHVEVDLPELVFQSGDRSIYIFAVYKPSTSSSNIGVFGNQAGSMLNIQLSDGKYGRGNGDLLMASAFGTNPHLITYKIDEENNVGGGANDSEIYHNGSLHNSFTFDEVSSSNVDTDFHIGKSGSNASSLFFQGDIHEIIIYYEDDGTEAISTSEKSQIESYLAIKYGISLSHEYTDSQ